MIRYFIHVYQSSAILVCFVFRFLFSLSYRIVSLSLGALRTVSSGYLFTKVHLLVLGWISNFMVATYQVANATWSAASCAHLMCALWLIQRSHVSIIEHKFCKEKENEENLNMSYSLDLPGIVLNKKDFRKLLHKFEIVKKSQEKQT